MQPLHFFFLRFFESGVKTSRTTHPLHGGLTFPQTTRKKNPVAQLYVFIHFSQKIFFKGVAPKGVTLFYPFGRHAVTNISPPKQAEPPLPNFWEDVVKKAKLGRRFQWAGSITPDFQVVGIIPFLAGGNYPYWAARWKGRSVGITPPPEVFIFLQINF